MSRRESLVALLARHVPTDDEEAGHLERMRAFARSLDDPLSREQPVAHFTASALVVDPVLARTFLVRHAKLGRWLQPGGHVEPEDESLLWAALREAREETGFAVDPAVEEPLDVDVHEFPAREGRPAHLHLDVRFLLVAAGPSRGEAAEEGAWFSRSAALAVADEAGLRRLIEKGLPR
jgi:8-oxo-dGTP pyrophosphatase MutT (NUDIX family)